MRVVVVGGAGFIGSHTIDALLQKKYEVICYDIQKPIQRHNNLKWYCYDVNSDTVEEAINEDDIILHLAAISSFSLAEKNPAEAIRTNIAGVANILRTAIEKKARKFIYASSGSVYPKDLEMPIKETDWIPGRDTMEVASIYELTKKTAETICAYYKIDIPITVLRYGHCYGPRETKGGIAAFIRRIMEGKSPIVFGGEQTNDFVYVGDIVQANLLAIEKEMEGIFNVGTGIETPIKKACKTVMEEMHYLGDIEYKPLRSVDWSRFVYDIRKIKKFGYEPEYSLEDGIRETVKWWRYNSPT